MKFIMIVFAALGLSACVSMPQPTSEDLSKADYGPEPKKPEAIIKKGMAPYLKDPYSVVVTVDRVVGKSWMRDYRTQKPAFGWGYCGTINAKNSFGGYTNAKPYFFLIRDEKLSLTEDYFRRIADKCK